MRDNIRSTVHIRVTIWASMGENVSFQVSAFQTGVLHKSQEGDIVRMTERIVEISDFLFSPLFDFKTSLHHFIGVTISFTRRVCQKLVERAKRNASLRFTRQGPIKVFIKHMNGP